MKKTTTMATMLVAVALLVACKKQKETAVETVADNSEEERLQMVDKNTIENEATYRLTSASNICCFTPATNITRDPEFLSIIPANLWGWVPCNNLKSSSMIGYNTNWFATPYPSNSPQVGVINCSTKALSMGACNRGYIHFWGNKSLGESISQDNLAFSPSVTYTVQFNARIRPGDAGTTRLGLRLSTAIPTTNPRTGVPSYSPNTYVSSVISDTTWRCYKFNFKDSTGGYKVLNLFPTNSFTSAPNFARLDIDDVKVW